MEEDTPEEGEAERAVVVAEEGDTHVDVEEGETEVATVVVVEEVNKLCVAPWDGFILEIKAMLVP